MFSQSDKLALIAKVKELAESAHKCSGLVYELYIKRFSQSIDNFVSTLDEPDGQFVLIIAREHDYQETLNDINFHDDDCCCHGFDVDCCPLGCGEGETTADYILDSTPTGYLESLEIYNHLEAMQKQIQNGKQCSPAQWTALKLMTVKQPEAALYCAEIDLRMPNIITTNQVIKQFQRVLLDARFEFRLDLKIQKAKDI
ncbi:hypothetical protein ABRZ80_20410 [Vibrio vulnificus]|uniref:hypothetical protein n=1 Tax=Vibrio vulnificus TaxID=672 RepID=UPI0032EAA4B7